MRLRTLFLLWKTGLESWGLLTTHEVQTQNQARPRGSRGEPVRSPRAGCPPGAAAGPGGGGSWVGLGPGGRAPAPQFHTWRHHKHGSEAAAEWEAARVCVCAYTPHTLPVGACVLLYLPWTLTCHFYNCTLVLGLPFHASQ